MTHIFHRLRTFNEGVEILLPQIGLKTLIRDIGKIIIKSSYRKISFLKLMVFVSLFIVARFSYWKGYVNRQRIDHLNSQNPNRER